MIYGYISNKTAVFSGENDDKHIKQIDLIIAKILGRC